MVMLILETFLIKRSMSAGELVGLFNDNSVKGAIEDNKTETKWPGFY